MGGEVLELINDCSERLVREAESLGVGHSLTQGFIRGYVQGYVRGYAQGLVQGASDVAARLRELGVKEEILDEAMRTMRERWKFILSVEEE